MLVYRLSGIFNVNGVCCFIRLYSGGFKGGGGGAVAPPPFIDRMHLKTGENFARKCINENELFLHKNFKHFLGRGHNPLHRPHLLLFRSLYKFLDPPLRLYEFQ